MTMNRQKPRAGNAALLFEKLTDLAPGSAEDDPETVIQTREALMASIRRELSRVLDTRLPWTRSPDDGTPEGDPSTVVGYGIPDLTHLCLRKQTDRAAVERLITAAVTTFEPRLLTPQVRIVATPAQDRAHLEITGVMQFREVLEPLYFRIQTNLRISDSGRAFRGATE